jgi:toxin ParE1/3/4
MAEFRVSRAARRDIEEIGRYTQEEWGAEQRRKYLAGLDDQLHKIAASPLTAAERAEFTPPVRLYPFGKHMIVYLTDETGVLIVRILHNRMDILSHLE